MVLPEARDRRDAVHKRHVQVEHGRLGAKLLGQLDRAEPVVRDADDAELGLAVDQLP